MKKILTRVRPLVEQGGKTKFCVHCGHTATQEALFKVDENVIILERYCDTCIKNVQVIRVFKACLKRALHDLV
jgi:hypothetical protein